MFLTFLKWMMAVTGIAWLLLALPLYILGESTVVWGVVVGCILPALCFVAGFYSIYRYFHLSLQKLMVVFFSGMLVRMLFIGAVLVLILLLTELHVISFLASLMGFYILYMILELYFVNSRLQRAEER